MSDDPTYRAKPAAALAREPRSAPHAPSELAPAVLFREHLSEQLEAVLALRDEIARTMRPAVDLARARERLAAGQVAYDPLEAVGSAGNLFVPFVRATVAIERAGLVQAREAAAARDARLELMPLVASWLGGEPVPRDRTRAAARRAAALVANAILRATSAAVLAGRTMPRATRATCPCCGCAPDFTRTERHAAAGAAGGSRTLLCARCDAEWATTRTGCTGCGASGAPSIAYVESPLLGYRLVLCNPCGRYLKEPIGPWSDDVTVERAMTAQLDAAAEARGLRL